MGEQLKKNSENLNSNELINPMKNSTRLEIHPSRLNSWTMRGGVEATNESSTVGPTTIRELG